MRWRLAITAAAMAAVLTAGGLYAETAPQKVVDLANQELVKLGTDPVVVAAVKAQNAAGKSLDDIKAMDKKWRNTPGVADFMQALMDSDCGRHLRRFQSENGYVAEIFVMDNQGANVAMTDKTSDYWQGDEAKFIESFNGGSGAVFVGDFAFDESAQAYLVQVSVPVRDDGAVIGAVTIGIDVDKMK